MTFYKAIRRLVLAVGIILGVLALAVGLTLATWALRPNRAEVDPDLVLESLDLVKDGLHNSNTDFIRLDGRYWLAYVSSPFHFGSSGSTLHLAVADSPTGPWTGVKSLKAPGDDIRDPKLAAIGGRLFLYALENRSFNPEPYRTVYSSSADGKAWDEFRPLEGLDGWLLWRTLDVGGTRYATAYWWEHGKAVLLRSPDGVRWDIVSTVNEGERNDETEALLLPGGRLLATARLEYDESWADGALGDPRGSTLISESLPPYDSWKPLAESRLTRLDGPALFEYRGRAFAIGRYQDGTGPLTPQGSCLARKRSSLFEVRADGLVRITDLPSSGDTSYGGVVVEGDEAWATYYSSPVDRDWAWILGMFAPSAVRIARIDLAAAAAKAAAMPTRGTVIGGVSGDGGPSP